MLPDTAVRLYLDLPGLTEAQQALAKRMQSDYHNAINEQVKKALAAAGVTHPTFGEGDFMQAMHEYGAQMQKFQAEAAGKVEAQFVELIQKDLAGTPQGDMFSKLAAAMQKYIAGRAQAWGGLTETVANLLGQEKAKSLQEGRFTHPMP